MPTWYYAMVAIALALWTIAVVREVQWRRRIKSAELVARIRPYVN